MSDELDVCPFCGAQPLLNEIEPHVHHLVIAGVKMPDHPGSWTIECPACECGMIADTKESVTAAWNRRAQPAEPQLDPITLRKMYELITKGYAQVGVIMGKEGERAYVDMGKVTWTQPAEEVQKDAERWRGMRVGVSKLEFLKAMDEALPEECNPGGRYPTPEEWDAAVDAGIAALAAKDKP